MPTPTHRSPVYNLHTHLLSGGSAIAHRVTDSGVAVPRSHLTPDIAA